MCCDVLCWLNGEQDQVKDLEMLLTFVLSIAKAYVIDLCQRTLWSADIQIDEHRLLFGKGTSIIHI